MDGHSSRSLQLRPIQEIAQNKARSVPSRRSTCCTFASVRPADECFHSALGEKVKGSAALGESCSRKHRTLQADFCSRSAPPLYASNRRLVSRSFEAIAMFPVDYRFSML